MSLSAIGIIGGGQLARMSAQAAQQMGFSVVILDPDKDCPAAQVTSRAIVGRIDNPYALRRLADQCNIVTLENEWVSPQHLRQLEDAGVVVYPGSHTLSLIGDKLVQRQRMASFGLPVPEAQPIASQPEARALAREWDYPLVLKARLGGYDGYGVRIIHNESEWQARFPEQTRGNWYAERYVAFTSELAVMVARDPSGEAAVYPVVQSAQTTDGHRCDWVVAPAPISPAAQEEGARVAAQAVRAIEGVGLFGVELFLSKDNTISINEIAPRPHNSGHYTMDCCQTSQFAQHIRAVSGLPLGPTGLLGGAAAMVNLLGARDGVFDFHAGLARALRAVPSAHVHWYGKRESRRGRKMGHINILAQTSNETLAQAQAARDAFWKEDPI